MEMNENLKSNDISSKLQSNPIKLLKAVYNFRGSNNDELNFNRDDVITLTQSPTGGWWEGTLNGTTGWFPSNYCQPFTSSEPEVKDTDSYVINSALNNTDFDSKQYSQQYSQQYRQMVFQDIEDTESSYVRDIGETVNKYLKPLQMTQIFAENEINSMLRIVEDIYSVHRRFLATLNGLNSVSHKECRIGGVFLDFAPNIKSVHLDYCANHSKFVHSIEKFKKEICSLFSGLKLCDPSAGNVQLTACLSASFRRLDKYPALLQELQRYTDESHIDRGDTQRAGFVYRELSMSCIELRRQKEMELEVMLGNIKNWDEIKIESFGEIIKMDLISIQVIPLYSEMKKDRYLVLFPQILLVLSVSTEMTSFVFEAKLRLEEAVIKTNEELIDSTNIFEIQTIDNKTTGAQTPNQTFIIQCPTIEDKKSWIELLQKYILYSQTLKHNTPSLINSTDSQRSTGLHSTQSTDSLSSNVILNATQTKRIGQLSHPSGSRYWMNRCLIPHPPTRMRPNSANSEQTDSKHKQMTANEDMLILQVIESYCNSGQAVGVRHSSSTSNTDCPQVVVIEGGKHVNSNCDKNSEEIVNTETELSLRDELKRLKMEMKELSDGLKAERRSRRKLKALLMEYKIGAKSNTKL